MYRELFYIRDKSLSILLNLLLFFLQELEDGAGGEERKEERGRVRTGSQERKDIRLCNYNLNAIHGFVYLQYLVSFSLATSRERPQCALFLAKSQQEIWSGTVSPCYISNISAVRKLYSAPLSLLILAEMVVVQSSTGPSLISKPLFLAF